MARRAVNRPAAACNRARVRIGTHHDEGRRMRLEDGKEVDGGQSKSVSQAPNGVHILKEFRTKIK